MYPDKYSRAVFNKVLFIPAFFVSPESAVFTSFRFKDISSSVKLSFFFLGFPFASFFFLGNGTDDFAPSTVPTAKSSSTFWSTACSCIFFASLLLFFFFNPWASLYIPPFAQPDQSETRRLPPDKRA